MAQVSTALDEKIYKLNRWLGVNQNPDGETKLKMGEACRMVNWQVTRDGNLKRRPGTKVAAVPNDSGEPVSATPVRCLWSGMVGVNETMLAACDSALWKIDPTLGTVTKLGTVNTSGAVSVFGFDRKAYVLDGNKYRVYDGSTLSEVVGYVPIVVTAAVPSGGGTALEQVNKLTGKRRVRFSPDGAAVDFYLPEQDLKSVDKVTNLVTGTDYVLETDYDYVLASGLVSFVDPPAAVPSSIEVWYTVKVDYRSQIESMRFAELYNGAQDTRVFLYGDGTYQTFYSGLDENGAPRADYFPDLNVLNVGEANTPVTALIRHGSRLIAFKTNSTWTISYGTTTLETGSVIPAFTVVPVNRSIGNVAPGQAQLVLNYPRTLFGPDCYEWKNASSYSSMLTIDERQARRISDRVHTTLGTFSAPDCVCWDDNDRQEYYIAYNGAALVHNYAADCWYEYSAFPAVSFCNYGGELYIGTPDGLVEHVSSAHHSDVGEWVPPVYDESEPPELVEPGYFEETPIDAYWESGALDFDADYMRKYSSMIWVTVKPESSSYVEITALTDRKSGFAVKALDTGTGGGFAELDFSEFSFDDSEQPKVRRLRLKAKKFVFYKLIFQTNRAATTATIIAADLLVRKTGYAK